MSDEMSNLQTSDELTLVFLIGFSGSGKSTVGRMLAQKLGYLFIDTDESVTRKERMSIPEIFVEKGEAYFRMQETAAIRHAIAKGRQSIIALGGGAFTRKDNLRLIQPAGTVVYLSCSAREIHRRLRTTSDRPLLAKEGPRLEKITSLLATRKRAYAKADMTISTTRHNPSEVVKSIMGKLRRLSDAH
jgi:shikimate kinase